MSIRRRVLITGGARGIGAAIAKELANRGCDLVAPGRSELDLAMPPSIDDYLKRNREIKFDVLINNAGINILNPLMETGGPAWEEMMQINLNAPLRLIQAVAPHMQAQGWGRILNVSSVFSLVTKEKRTAYSITKAGLNALTRSAAVELGPRGILVNALCPGYVETELTKKNNSPSELEAIKLSIPLRRLALPEELARTAAFLCSEENTYLTGQTIVVDGGFICK